VATEDATSAHPESARPMRVASGERCIRRSDEPGQRVVTGDRGW
jgi:hypothetical protein